MTLSGVAAAIVVENRDAAGLGRVKVRYPWHSDPQSSYWARVAAPMAGRRRGLYGLPEVSDEVLVAFEQGDLRRPCVLGGLWNSSDPPPETNADGRNDVRMLRTRSGHELTFDDGATGRVRLELRDGKHLTIEDSRVTLQDEHGNGFTIESGSGTVSIRSAGRVQLQAPAVSVEASGAIDIKAGATLTLRGSLVSIN